MMPRRFSAVATALACFSLVAGAFAAPQQAAQEGVTVTEDATSFTMSNGVVTARVLKRNGDLANLFYKGVDTLTDQSGHAGAYWSHDASGYAGIPATDKIAKITIDPKTNGGTRAEVSVKAIANGHRLGRPAGLAAGAEGDFPADIEIRYTLNKGETGVYTYSIFEHKPEYPAGSMGEARFCAKLASMFDWLSVDPHRNKYYPKEEPGEDKYVYTAVQSENLAYGFSSTTKKVGWWLINPTIEYLSGGPTKVEFLCHRDTTAVEAPCVLNYWRSSHYGGAVVDVAQGEHWKKVVGPFMLFVNEIPDSGNRDGDAMTLWNKAREQAKIETSKWPYDWVEDSAYPKKAQRSTVTGAFNLVDPLMPGGAKFLGNLSVGLTAANRMPANTGTGRQITWQTDAKNYQFWARNDDKNGKFTIPNVNPGTYTLRAYADGILGDFAKAEVKISEGGKPTDLGAIEWKPTRRGKELWQVGIPNRTAKEFKGGDFFFAPDTQIQYAKLFPDDVNFVIGKSDIAKDWYYEHIPHNIDPAATVVPFSGVRSQPGKATPYKITFDLPAAPKGKATLRLAFCTASAQTLQVAMNDQAAGQLSGLASNADSTIVRHNIQGIWFEREHPIDVALMKPGTNTLTLTVPGGSLNNGVIYDCVRLELDEAAQ